MELGKSHYKRAVEMLQMLKGATKEVVANHYNLTMRGLDSWLNRIRNWREDNRWFENNLLVLERRDRRMTKILSRADESNLTNELDDELE